MTEHVEDSGSKAALRPESSRRPVPSRPQKLVRRADFLAAAKGKRFHSRSFSLQAVARQKPAAGAPKPGMATPPTGEPEACEPRFGLTVTKRLGSAVVRNRIRRRLKEALRLAPALPARPCHDYVIVARPAALNLSFSALQHELQQAIAAIHAPASAGRGKGKMQRQGWRQE